MGRVVVIALAVLGLLAPSALADPSTGAPRAGAPSWAAAEIEQVLAAGLLGGAAASDFRPDDPLTRGELYDALVVLGLPSREPPDRAKPVTMRELDAKLVAALRLLPAARRIRIAARDAGLRPPAWLGTETVARLLSLRVNHPFGEDALERALHEPATRAEAAYSLSKVLTLDPAAATQVDALSQGFVPPGYTEWQRTVLSRAVRFVGTPYVWTGISERPQLQWAADGVTQLPVPGGFDCSGFVWRVYKLQPFAGAPAALTAALRGRTTYDMSGEVPADRRIPLDALQPGDLVFFGPKGAKSKPQQVDHMGIYVGSGWFVHSSRAGVTLQPMEGWYLTGFAWGRRPLAEAGLTV